MTVLQAYVFKPVGLFKFIQFYNSLQYICNFCEYFLILRRIYILAVTIYF